MWLYFTEKRWFLWGWLGSVVILTTLWLQVQMDVAINEWFGEFYDMLQSALSTPGAVEMDEYLLSLADFAIIAAGWIGLSLMVTFFTSHWLFRWRQSMVEWYHSVYDKARKIEGASQRVQEDTIKFSRIMESLGTSFIESVMVLVEFFPILVLLGAGIPVMFFGEWEYGLVAGAIIWAVGGTILMLGLAWLLRLVGVEYDLQKREAAYRKILVIAEDDGTIRPKSMDELFMDVRSIHFTSYIKYLWFNVGRLAYLQANVLVPYVLFAPSIVGGLMTLGVFQQAVRAFGRVEGSMQYLFKAWPTVIELFSVIKRLREFERQIKES
jgi:peptide/bleomycin uptake transporter